MPRAPWLAGLLWAACSVGGAAAVRATAPPPDAGLPSPEELARAEAEDDAKAREEAQIAAIETAVNSQQEEIYRCWERAAADDFHVEGRVTLRITLAARGQVERVDVGDDEVRDPVLTDCLRALYQAYPFTEVFDAGDAIELPLSFVAPAVQYTVRRADAHSYPIGDGKLVATVLLDPANTGNRAASMTILTAQAGASVPLHRHESAELLLALGGAGELLGPFPPAHRKVPPGSAVYLAPHTPHGFAMPPGAAPAELLQLYAPAGPEARFMGGTDPGTQPVTGPVRTRGVPRPVVIDGARVAALPILGGQGSVQILFDAAAAKDPAAYLGLITLEAGAKVPEHRHDKETELLYVREGTGTMTIAGIEYPIEAGMAIQVPPATPHAFVAATRVVAVQYYTPSGPEQRFRPAAGNKR